MQFQLQNNATDEEVVLESLHGYSTHPLVSVNLKFGIVMGPVKLALAEGEYMPASGVSLLLGNYLVGRLVVPNPIVVEEHQD